MNINEINENSRRILIDVSQLYESFPGGGLRIPQLSGYHEVEKSKREGISVQAA